MLSHPVLLLRKACYNLEKRDVFYHINCQEKVQIAPLYFAKNFVNKDKKNAFVHQTTKALQEQSWAVINNRERQVRLSFIRS